LIENFHAVLRDHTAGDPMREDVKWTNLSRRQISRKLKELGTPAGKNVASRLLYEHGYRRRKPQKKRTMGQHVDRNAQFENIARLRQEYLDCGKPVISIDTKKKEMLGNFHRDGVTDAVEPTIVNDHDFASNSDGKVIPHGIYDLRKNEASLHLNGSHDTTELACESIELWWHEQGQSDYPSAEEILILCDGGGSNSSSAYIFKEDLQALSNRLGLKLRIAHYPPYCSKYNPFEHRVFPHVTRACKGVPLETIETAQHYMEKAETTKGLKVVVRIIDKVFEAGRKYAADFKENMTIQFDELLPKWNYTATPQTE
jgi:Rhodopirellula transposase DDE domain